MAQSTARETAGITTRLIVASVRRHAGERGVERLLARSGVPYTLEHLEDERSWSSYDDKVALLTAAGEILGDPQVGFTIGSRLLEEQVGSAIRLLIGSLGSPQQVLRSVARAQVKFSTSATMSTVEVRRGGGTVTYRLHPPNRPTRVDCDYTKGVLSQVSVLFGLPQATIVEPACQVDGAEECRYVVSWPQRRFRDRFRSSRDATAPFEADALREQLADLQSTVADLVSTPQLEDLLHRIASRAGASVRGLRYLLAVQLEGEPQPRVHAEGFASDAAARLGAELLAGTTLTPEDGRIVAEVASTRRRYGWLAAELPPGEGFLPTEQQQLDSYGRLAAAALDAATALEAARRRGETAEVLLRLGHELAREDDQLGVAQRLCAAVPSVLGAPRSLVMLWDEELQLLRAVAVAGFGDDGDNAWGVTFPYGAGTDDVATMAQPPAARWMAVDDPALPEHELLQRWNVALVATAPIVARGRLAGVLVAVWHEQRPPDSQREVLLGRLAALADQGTTALAGADALNEARYRASHDALTGLANRVLFTERIEQALVDGRRTGSRPSVCFIDLDGFKGVNDAHGHAVGDQLLIQVGHRVKGALRESDSAARLSGDEFGVLLRGLDGDDDAEVVAAKLVAALGAPYLVDDLELRISASIGVASAPADETTPDQLLIAADHAMYRAKRQRGTYRLAEPDAAPAGHG